ncbi:MAG: helix-turn-helix transcriptional regulator [Bdellovibrio sp.]
MKKNEIRFYRLRKGITQENLAQVLGVTQQAVAKWESNQTSVSENLIPKIEKALGVRKENLFPELRVQVLKEQQQNEIINERMDYILPFEAIFNFKSRTTSYCTNVDKKNYERIIRALNDKDTKLLWFETLENMIVVVNKEQISSAEIGYDLGIYPNDIIDTQKMGSIDSDFEVNGDDRLIRLFVEGAREPFCESPDAERDYPNLMRVLSSALDDYLSFHEFFHFEHENGYDIRTIYCRPEKLELIEGPKIIYKQFIDYICKVDGITEKDSSPINPIVSYKKSKKQNNQIKK